MLDGKIGKDLKKLLKKNVLGEVQESLAVADAKLGAILKEKLNVSCVSNSSIMELMRGIRSQMDTLIGELPQKETAAMALGLAHSLSRYKLKFSPEKVDTMIIQAVSLLDDLDKELNNYVMRCKEWYGWHFPEVGKLVTDPIAFVKVVMKMGIRENAHKTDLSDILPEELEEQLKQAAEISMGTEISDFDIANIKNLCSQIVEISSYRTQLYEYLKNRMMALAPNLTILLGELVGARLIAHAGSLMNLAKYPASTVQILGAEKALFRALKTKRDTPKYGLIYHAQLIGHTPGNLKGKMSRMLAAKAALACRVDALGEDNTAELGLEHRQKLENRIQVLQNQGSKKVSGTGKAGFQFQSYKVKGEAIPYDASLDSTMPKKRKFEEAVDELPKEMPSQPTAPSFVPSSIKRKKIKSESHDNEQPAVVAEEAPVVKTKKDKKVKAEKVEEKVPHVEEQATVPEASPKKKKKQKKAKAEVQDENEN
uniref:Nucleolar protein 58 n=1 Tax=Romanomermis culicivorax TaxID=13658 RepID=A0A915I1C8_ROMCU